MRKSVAETVLGHPDLPVRIRRKLRGHGMGFIAVEDLRDRLTFSGSKGRDIHQRSYPFVLCRGNHAPA